MPTNKVLQHAPFVVQHNPPGGVVVIESAADPYCERNVINIPELYTIVKIRTLTVDSTSCYILFSCARDPAMTVTCLCCQSVSRYVHHMSYSSEMAMSFNKHICVAKLMLKGGIDSVKQTSTLLV